MHACRFTGDTASDRYFQQLRAYRQALEAREIARLDELETGASEERRFDLAQQRDLGELHRTPEYRAAGEMITVCIGDDIQRILDRMAPDPLPHNFT